MLKTDNTIAIPNYITSLKLVNLLTGEEIEPCEKTQYHFRFGPLYLDKGMLELRLRIDFSVIKSNEPVLKVNLFKISDGKRTKIEINRHNDWHCNETKSERTYIWEYENYHLELKTMVSAFSERGLYSKGC